METVPTAETSDRPEDGAAPAAEPREATFPTPAAVDALVHEEPPGVAFPTPADTDALVREELREAAQRKRFPAAQGLAAFLRDPAQTQQITGKADPRTNIIDQGDRVTYALPGDAVASLFALLEGGRREGLAAHFSERQGTPEAPACGIMLDYDLVVGAPDVSVSERSLHRIACRVVLALRRDLVFAAGEATVHVFSIVKPEPVPVEADKGGEARFKYGFHLLAPGVHVSRGYKKYLVRALREDAGICGALTALGALGDPRECLDLNSPSVPVLFAGSCKRGGVPYGFGPAFEISFEAGGGEADFFPMVRALRPADLEKEYNLVAETSVCFEAQYPDKRPPLVPVQARVYRPELAAEIEDLAARTQNLLADPRELLLAEHSLSTLAVHDPEARYLHQILDLLDESYWTERNKWRDVVFALANTSETYKPLAEWFSQKYYKWGDGTTKRLEGFDQLWEDAVARRGDAHPLTKRSLIRWAQLCNPERFRQISEQSYFSLLARYVYDYGGILEHYMVAKVLHAMLGNKFVVDIDEGHRGRYTYCWFEFVVPGQVACPGEVWKWRKEVEPDELQAYLSENLVKVLEQVAEHIEEQRAAAENEDQASYYKKLGGAFLSSRRKVFNDTFKNGVVKQANYLFRRRGFVDALDKDSDLIGVGNGVLRLGPTCELIDHFHEFPVLKFTPVPFRPFDPADPWTRLMLGAIADIIPEPDFREWLLFFAASSLAGGVKEGILLLWNGGGANGKTFVMRMVAKAVGKHYAKKLNIALLTSERESADRPNSAVMQLKGCRWGYVEETQKAEPLNSQRLKELVNPGEISGRDLNKAQENFEVTANIAVGQNYDFAIDTTDHGTWRRLRHYRSKVRFCMNPDPRNPYEKKDDQRFVREYINDGDCQAAFLGILVFFYERLQREYGGELKRVPCPTLERETEVFRNGQDTINRFISEAVVASPDFKVEYPLAVVAGHYVTWYSTNIDRCRHVASEIIQDLENSALQRFIRRAPNKTLVLAGCRILTDDARSPTPGESYLGAEAPAEAPAAKKTPAGAPCQDWWAGASPAAGPLREANPADEFDIDSDFGFDEPYRRKAADPLEGLELDEILDGLPERYTLEDVFADVVADVVADDVEEPPERYTPEDVFGGEHGFVLV